MSSFHLNDGDVIRWEETPRVRREGALDLQEVPAVEYEIVQPLSTSESYGLSYKARVVSGDLQSKSVFIKIPNISAHLPRYLKQKRLREIGNSFEAQVDVSDRLKEINDGNYQTVACIRKYGHFMLDVQGEGPYRIPFLVQDFIDYPKMEDFFKSYNDRRYCDADGNFSGISDPPVWFSLASKIIDIVRRVHNRQIVHGDISQKNILLHASGEEIFPTLVDFGRSFQLDVASVTGSEKRQNDPYVAPECRAGNLDWYTPADIYSLGGVLFYMATGQAPPDILASKDIFPTSHSWMSPDSDQIQRWKERIHSHFPSTNKLIERNEGIVKVIDKCLRPSPVTRYASTERILHAIDAVNLMSGKATDIRDRTNELSSRWEDIERQGDFDLLFEHIFHDKLDLLRKELTDMERGHFEIYGEREELIDTLVKYMGVLQPGDTYITVTVPAYWTEENLGVNGRFLTINKDLVKNGVCLYRLFLLCPTDFAVNSPTIDIIRAHQQTLKTLNPRHKCNKVLVASDVSGINEEVLRDTGKMFVGFVEFKSSESLMEVQRQNSHVAIINRVRTKEKISITFESQPEYDVENESLVLKKTRIVKVRFRKLSGSFEFDQMLKMFEGEKIAPLEALEYDPAAKRLFRSAAVENFEP